MFYICPSDINSNFFVNNKKLRRICKIQTTKQHLYVEVVMMPNKHLKHFFMNIKHILISLLFR